MTSWSCVLHLVFQFKGPWEDSWRMQFPTPEPQTCRAKEGSCEALQGVQSSHDTATESSVELVSPLLSR